MNRETRPELPTLPPSSAGAEPVQVGEGFGTVTPSSTLVEETPSGGRTNAIGEAMAEGTERGGKENPGGFEIPKIRKLFKIGEVMAYTGISRQTLHNYTMLGLITEEERTESGHRLYGEEVFERLARINALKANHSLKEVREILEKEDG